MKSHKVETQVFPITATGGYFQFGLTKREWLAGLAMQGAIAHKGNFSVIEAYEAADAMLERRHETDRKS